MATKPHPKAAAAARQWSAIVAWLLTCAIGIRRLPHYDRDVVLLLDGATTTYDDDGPPRRPFEDVVLPPGCNDVHRAIEIGTSSGAARSLLSAAPAGTARRDGTGLSVDVSLHERDQRPPDGDGGFPCWPTIRAGVVGRPSDVPKGGVAIVHWVDDADLFKHDLPWWWRGRHSVEWPHPDDGLPFRPTGSDLLRRRGLSHLLKNATVPVYSLPRLLDDRSACRVGSLRVAAEGMDADLLIAYSLWVEGRNGTCYADEIVWGLDKVDVDAMGKNNLLDAALGRVGYSRDMRNTTLMPKDRMVWRYEPRMEEGGEAEGASVPNGAGAARPGRDAVGREHEGGGRRKEGRKTKKFDRRTWKEVGA